MLHHLLLCKRLLYTSAYYKKSRLMLGLNQFSSTTFCADVMRKLPIPLLCDHPCGTSTSESTQPTAHEDFTQVAALVLAGIVGAAAVTTATNTSYVTLVIFREDTQLIQRTCDTRRFVRTYL